MTTTAQQPLISGFGASSTADDVIKGVDLAGKVAIVTGGYSGIGFETVRVLRAAGAEVVVAAQQSWRARAALAGIDGVEIVPMDLIDPGSIDAFADKFLGSGRPLHLLVNNGGVMATPLARDGRGYESQFAINHLGHFQLTTRLWPALTAAGRSDGARVVTLASRGHRSSPVVFDDLHFERREYEPFAAYGQSKSANSLFTVELDRRGRDEGVRAFAVHPGFIMETGLVRHIDPAAIRATGVIDEHGDPIRDPERQLKSVPQGAATTIWCATSPQLEANGGVYCENCDIALAVPADSTEELGVRPWAIDPELADRLWVLSERLTGKRIQ